MRRRRPLVLGIRPAARNVAPHPHRHPEREQALAARDDRWPDRSGQDQQNLDAQAFLAREEGVFVEPASAAGVAGLLAKHQRGEVGSGLQIAITVTGHGLKDVDTALSRLGPIHAEVVNADLLAIATVCGLLD